METTSRNVQPKILEKMIELQVQHDLPVHITVGDEEDGLVRVFFEYELIDYYVVAWLINKGTQHFMKLPQEAIMAIHD